MDDARDRRDEYENAGVLRDLCLRIDQLRQDLGLESWNALGRVVARDIAEHEARARGEHPDALALAELAARRQTMLHPIKRDVQPGPATLQALARQSGQPIDVWHAAAHWVPESTVAQTATTDTQLAAIHARVDHMHHEYQPDPEVWQTAMDISKTILKEGQARREREGRQNAPRMLNGNDQR